MPMTDFQTAELPPETPSRRRRTAWLREPLLHFVLLGGALFAVDLAVNGGADDARVIVVDAAVDQEALKVFRDARGREPSTDELYALRRVWLENEVLYREGLALQMDKGDKAIKDRVIFKALSMINAGIKRPPFDDTVLRAWFEQNRIRYDEPARFDFEEAVLDGDASEAAATGFAAALDAGTPGDAKAGLRVFKARPHPTIVQSYGAEFTAALEALPPGRWQALRHGDGWRVMRLDAVAPARQASFDALRGVVLADWTDAVMAEQRSAAVRTLAKKYSVRVEGSTP
jgi:PPIC-type PPIASE domain